VCISPHGEISGGTPDAQTLKRLAYFFEVSVDYPLGRIDPYPLAEELQKGSAWEFKRAM